MDENKVTICSLGPDAQIFDMRRMGSVLEQIADGGSAEINILSPSESFDQSLWSDYFKSISDEPNESGFFSYSGGNADRIRTGAKLVSESLTSYVRSTYDKRMVVLSEKSKISGEVALKCNNTVMAVLNDGNFRGKMYQGCLSLLEQEIALARDLSEECKKLGVTEMSAFDLHVQFQEKLLAAMKQPEHNRDYLDQIKQMFSTPHFSAENT